MHWTVERAERRAVDHPATTTMAGVAAHARGLLDREPDALATAVQRYRSGIRPLALASALEDAGSHAASRGHRTTAVQWPGEALEIYARLGATWDAAVPPKAARPHRNLGFGYGTRVESPTHFRCPGLPFTIGSATTHGASNGCSAFARSMIAGTSEDRVCNTARASTSS